MPALELLHGWRVVAKPDALDRAVWSGKDVIVLRFAADEGFGVGAGGVKVDDPDAITGVDHGFVGAWLTHFDLGPIRARTEWALPTDIGSIAQGKIAGVPAKLWRLVPPKSKGITLDGAELLLVTQAAYAHELAERLGWLG